MYASPLISIPFILLSTTFFCEYLIYYIFVCQCSWPHLTGTSKYGDSSGSIDSEELKVAFIADTHLLGLRNGHWFDKLRREWQMYRSFQTLIQIHGPEVIFILGDVFDEASFSPDEIYSTYLRRFHELFHVDRSREIYVVAGNHDVGFHYAMHPYLDHRFRQTMNVTSLVTKKKNHFVLINSMALEKDGCHICKNTERQIQILSDKFRCSNGTMKCPRNQNLKTYSRPILLMHFPLYRESDAHCTGWNAGSYKERRVRFRERWDCLSKEATDYVLNKLHPRVAFTGHTHHSCKTHHKPDIPEYTIPSFNWRNTPNPSFSMAVFTSNDYLVQNCVLPHEYIVIFLYIVAVILSVMILYRYRRRKRRKYVHVHDTKRD